MDMCKNQTLQFNKVNFIFIYHSHLFHLQIGHFTNLAGAHNIRTFNIHINTT